MLATPAAQRLVWVPGIGKMVAYTLLLEIDDIRRFPTVRHFHSYCRLVPGSANSGGKTKHKRSRDGNRYLKMAFHFAAIRAVQHFGEIRTDSSGCSAGRGNSSRGHSSPQGARDDRLRHAQQGDRLQWDIPWTPPHSHQALHVAPTGKPARPN